MPTNVVIRIENCGMRAVSGVMNWGTKAMKKAMDLGFRAVTVAACRATFLGEIV